MHTPNENESADSASRDAEPTLGQAEPYRSPVEVSEQDSAAGVKRFGALTLGMWLLLGGGLAVGGVASYALLKPVNEFGGTRAGPPKPMVDHVEDFGWERRPVDPGEILGDEILPQQLSVPPTQLSVEADLGAEVPQP